MPVGPRGLADDHMTGEGVLPASLELLNGRMAAWGSRLLPVDLACLPMRPGSGSSGCEGCVMAPLLPQAQCSGPGGDVLPGGTIPGWADS